MEAHVAAILRQPEAPKEASVVLNNPPCVGRGPMRGQGCDDLLPGMLPRGTGLLVYLTDGTRTWLHRRYEGTGEGLLG